MYKTEIDRFNKKIDEEHISLTSRKTLHDVIEEFFAVNYENISEKRKREVELDFKLRRIESKSRIRRVDTMRVEEIFNQIENSLFNILDQSFDKSRKSFLEKILNSIPSINIIKYK